MSMRLRRNERSIRRHLLLITGGQTPFIGDQIFGTIFHSLRSWNMNSVNCAFWGVKLINILRFIVNDRFGVRDKISEKWGWVLSLEEKIPPTGWFWLYQHCSFDGLANWKLYPLSSPDYTDRGSQCISAVIFQFSPHKYSVISSH